MRWNQGLRYYMKDHLPLYIFVSVLFVMGVIFGAVMVGALSLDQREEMSRYFGSFFNMLNDGDPLDTQATFQQTFGMHMRWLLLIWVLGLSVIGLPFILLLDFLKGVLIGFTVGYLAAHLSWKGVLFSLVSVVPQNLFIIPAIIICSVAAISFSIYIVKNRFLHGKGSVYPLFMRYSILTLTMAFVLLGVSVFEAVLSPGLMKWVSPMLAGLEPIPLPPQIWPN